MCLNEIWLKPDELHVISETLEDSPLLNEKYIVIAKSGMQDVEPDYTGRPFGGTAIICKQSKRFYVKETKVENNRVTAINICDPKGNVLQTVLSVYMPYYDRSKPGQTNLYVEALDAIQSYIDSNESVAPIKIFGDFNVQLPRNSKLHRSWYKKHGFNNHSKLMYDFLAENELSVAGHLFPQSVKYTYFCHDKQAYSWIDHVASSSHDLHNIVNCQIIPLDCDNLSDHLPVRVTI